MESGFDRDGVRLDASTPDSPDCRRMAAVLSAFRRGALAALEAVFPLECVSCGRRGEYCCPSCLSTVATLPPRRRRFGKGGLLIGYPYAHPLIRRLIKDWKYGEYAAAGPAVRSLVSRWHAKHAGALPTIDLVTAVPLHPARLRERGFNQAERLAQEIGGAADLPLAPSESLRRLLRTRPQAELDLPGDRAANVAGAFTAAPAVFLGRRALLIDDVCTTGATLAACAEALRDAGAATTHAFALSGGNDESPG
jgi:ComF family protein